MMKGVYENLRGVKDDRDWLVAEAVLYGGGRKEVMMGGVAYDVVLIEPVSDERERRGKVVLMNKERTASRVIQRTMLTRQQRAKVRAAAELVGQYAEDAVVRAAYPPPDGGNEAEKRRWEDACNVALAELRRELDWRLLRPSKPNDRAIKIVTRRTGTDASEKARSQIDKVAGLILDALHDWGRCDYCDVRGAERWEIEEEAAAAIKAVAAVMAE